MHHRRRGGPHRTGRGQVACRVPPLEPSGFLPTIVKAWLTKADDLGSQSLVLSGENMAPALFQRPSIDSHSS